MGLIMSDDFFNHSENWEEKYIEEKEDDLKECKSCGASHIFWLSCSQIQWKNSDEYRRLYKENLKRCLDEVGKSFK